MPTRTARLRRRAIRFVLLAAWAVLVAGCVPEAVLEFEDRGLNPRLRPDRLALTGEQVNASVESLGFGPYRDGVSALVSPIVPADDNATRLPQSDCWWMARDPGGGTDMVRAHWENVVDIVGDANLVAQLADPGDDRLDIGLCRLNDPETREPPRSRGSDNIESAGIDCGRLGNTFAFVHNQGRSIPTCLTDTALLGVQIEAWRSRANDPFLRCAPTLAAFDVLDRQIITGVDQFDGLTARSSDGPVGMACSAAVGNRLAPAQPTRYRLRSSAANAAWLAPVVWPVAGGASPSQRLARQMTSAQGSAWRWRTPVGTGTDGAVRWEENFSGTLRVARVRVFRPTPALQRAYVAPAAPLPPLCIGDDGSDCRYACDGAVIDDQLTYDLFAGACREAGAGVIPPLTPTYAVNAAQARTLREPLTWSLTLAGTTPSDTDPPWLEFELVTMFQPGALRASPAVIDMGAARTGEYRRGLLVVENVGAHPMRITSVAIDASRGGAIADFRVQLPTAPQPIALPAEVIGQAGRATRVALAPGAAESPLVTRHADGEHTRYRPRRDGVATTVDGVVVRSDRGLLLREGGGTPLAIDSKRTRAVRVTYALRMPPFDLMPGDGFEVSVIGTPSALGERQATLRVAAVSLVDPALTREVFAVAKVHGLQGPLLHALPTRLDVHARGAGSRQTRVVLVENAGDTAGAVAVPQLTRVGGAALPAGSRFRLVDPYGTGGTLASGASRAIDIQYTSACGIGDWFREQAELRWGTVNGTLIVPVDASTYCGR